MTDANVISALASVIAEIGGIQRLTPEQRRARTGNPANGEAGVSYAYRGIDQIAAAAQPLLGKAGVVIVPSVTARETFEITVNNRPWTDTFVQVEWAIFGPGGVEDRITAVTEGWGRDNSDKGINKAMTGAYKNLLLRLLHIGDPGDDTDGHTHERSNTRQDPAPDPVRVTFAAVKAAAGTPAADALKDLAFNAGRKLTAKEFADHPEWRELVELTLARARDDSGGINPPSEEGEPS